MSGPVFLFNHAIFPLSTSFGDLYVLSKLRYLTAQYNKYSSNFPTILFFFRAPRETPKKNGSLALGFARFEIGCVYFSSYANHRGVFISHPVRGLEARDFVSSVAVQKPRACLLAASCVVGVDTSPTPPGCRTD